MQIPKIPKAMVHTVIDNTREALLPNTDAMKKMEMLYSQMDPILEFISPYFPCEEKCSHCCKWGIDVTMIEVEYIQQKTDHSIKEHIGITRDNEECFFLLNDSCSIYKYRPLICRTYHSQSASSLCRQQNRKLDEYGTLRSGFGNDIFKQIFIYIQHLNATLFKNETGDIRMFF